ncbi:MAG: elongation factor G [Methanoregula sp. PtaU1.Bin051]|nr:MAG: elongation factor G [Methanoregula sp. PtaU1.Bin051]
MSKVIRLETGEDYQSSIEFARILRLRRRGPLERSVKYFIKSSRSPPYSKKIIFPSCPTETLIDLSRPCIPMEADRLKIVVFGAFGAGKTTLIKTLDPGSKHIEAPCTGGTTTIALDYGKIEVGGRQVYLFGTPGQERFEFARKVIGRGMDGAILLVDATGQYDEFVAHLHDSLSAAKIPFMVVLNKCEEIGAQPDQLKEKISSARVVQASARKRPECEAVLKEFVATLPPGRHGNNHRIG